MTNDLILGQLTNHRDIIYNRLSNISLAALFAKEYENVASGEARVMSEDLDDIKRELIGLSQDFSHDEAFKEQVELLKVINSNDQVIEELLIDWQKLLDGSITSLVNEPGAAFIWYDAYDSPGDNTVSFHGKKKYPELAEPKYLDGQLYKDELLVVHNAFNFKKAWPDCEAFEWTTAHLEVYFDLQNLFKLNSRVLLHKALNFLEEKESIQQFPYRPFNFYIAEHDQEVSMLYLLT